MVDRAGFYSIQEIVAKTKWAVDNEEWLRATVFWRDIQHVLFNATGSIDLYNILYKTSPNHTKSGDEPSLDELMNSKVKNKLGLNVTWGAQSGEVFYKLCDDFMKPVTDRGA